MIKMPDEIPMLLNKGQDKIVGGILANPDDHEGNLIRLSKICKVKVKFNRPVTIRLNRRRGKADITEHIFRGFFKGGVYSICYLFSTGNHGYPLDMSTVESYAPVMGTDDNFTSYEQFKRKFDLFFITENMVQELWNGKSSQHGERYKPSDFKSISESGKRALRMFLRNFKGIDSTDITHYRERKWDDGKVSHTTDGYYYGSGGNFSRDISVSHTMGNKLVHYSSEYHGCGNGSYGLVASRNTWLHLEDD